MGLDTKTDSLTGRQSQYDFDLLINARYTANLILLLVYDAML
jgi:hypothetical protein